MQRTFNALCITSAFGLLNGCIPPVVTAVKSPDGVLVAKLIDDRGGGAATAAYQRVVVEEASNPFGSTVTVFEGENTSGRRFGDLNVSWLDTKTLALGYCDGEIDRVEKHAQVGGRNLEVRIIQEKPGNWPVSISSERRAGPPPCV